ncbi:hypothetical protein [Kitasatospora sp. NPDC059327]|uniref:hypothetical protein n=1 Tax=Kitasatospora sp. NPDC059327 TaxID=3346803 RepID=UPI00369FAE8E
MKSEGPVNRALAAVGDLEAGDGAAAEQRRRRGHDQPAGRGLAEPGGGDVGDQARAGGDQPVDPLALSHRRVRAVPD